MNIQQYIQILNRTIERLYNLNIRINNDLNLIVTNEVVINLCQKDNLINNLNEFKAVVTKLLEECHQLLISLHKDSIVIGVTL